MSWLTATTVREGWPGIGPFAARLAPAREALLADVTMNPASIRPDTELFALICAGDHGAFAEFYDRHSSLLYGIAVKVLVNEAEAEEVLQEACVAIWERAPLYQPSAGQPLSWAVTLVRNRAIDRLRSSRRKAELIEAAAVEAELQEAESGDASDATMTAETAGFVRGALETLSADQRQAIQLTFYRGLTQQEIAAQLGQPLGTIKARIRRGMLALRDQLEGQL